jgi:hypothetical protein
MPQMRIDFNSLRSGRPASGSHVVDQQRLISLAEVQKGSFQNLSFDVVTPNLLQ